MTAMSAGASLLAHGIHYAVLGVGLFGLALLLGPRLAGPRQGSLDDHDERVRALRRQLQNGPATPARPALPRAALERAGTRAETVLLPLAVVSSAAAAGIHAALGPSHLREQTLFGVFFAAAAVLQFLWAALAVLHPTRAALRAGMVGNLAVLGLWASPAYLDRRGRPASPDELAGHDIIRFSRIPQGFRLIAGNHSFALPEGRLKADDMQTVRSLVLRGLGIGPLPHFTRLTPELSLERVLPEYSTEPGNVYFVYPAQRFVTANVRAFMELAKDC